MGSTLSCIQELCLTRRQSRINVNLSPRSAVEVFWLVRCGSTGHLQECMRWYMFGAPPRLLLWRGAGDSSMWLPDWGFCTLNNVFLMPFWQQPVYCIKRGPQDCDCTSPEKLLFLRVWDHPGAWVFAPSGSWWQLIVANVVWGCGRRGWGCSCLWDMVLPPWSQVGPWKPAISMPEYLAGSSSRQQQQAPAHQQGLSPNQIIRAAERRTGEGSPSLFYLRLHLVAWQGSPLRV